MSDVHHTFWDEIGHVMILVTFRTSVGEPFGLRGLLLSTLFEVIFFITFEVTASNSERGDVGSLKQLPPCAASEQGPTQIRPLALLKGTE